MSLSFFKPIRIIDPLTGKEKIVDENEQEEMLEKGILIAPIKKIIDKTKKK